MFYKTFTAERFFTEITTEADARALLWRSRFQGKDFQCPTCHSEQFYALRTRPEVRHLPRLSPATPPPGRDHL